MLTGFKNAVEVDFTLEENKKKIEEAFKQAHAEAGAVYPLIIGGKKVETEKKICFCITGYKGSTSDMHAHAVKNRLMRQLRHLTKHQKMEPDICRRKSTCIKKTCSTSDREPFHHGCMERP